MSNSEKSTKQELSKNLSNFAINSKEHIAHFGIFLNLKLIRIRLLSAVLFRNSSTDDFFPSIVPKTSPKNSHSIRLATHFSDGILWRKDIKRGFSILRTLLRLSERASGKNQSWSQLQKKRKRAWGE